MQYSRCKQGKVFFMSVGTRRVFIKHLRLRRHVTPVVHEFFTKYCHYFRNLQQFLFQNTPCDMNSAMFYGRTSPETGNNSNLAMCNKCFNEKYF